MHPQSSRVARALVVIAASALLLFVISNTLPVLEQVSYIQAYAKGNVSQGYITKVEGEQLVQREMAGLYPYIVQIVGILGMTVVLLTIVGLVERSMNQKRVGELPSPDKRLETKVR